MFKKIYIEITNTCNLNCSFCKGSRRPKSFMSIEDFELILKKIKSYTEYICLYVLGEPFMHPDLKTILDKALEYNMKVILTTNGRLLDKNIDLINSSTSIHQLNISLHSFNNIADIEQLLNTIDKIKMNGFISLRLWNTNTNNLNDQIINLINNHYHVNLINDKSNKKVTDKLYLNFEEQFEWPNVENNVISEKGTCYGTRTHIGILVDGTIVPCCLDSDGIINLGNIFKDNMKTILNSQRYKNINEGFKNRKLVEDLCKRCSYISRFY